VATQSASNLDFDAMNIQAEIELQPSFHEYHVWSVSVADNAGEVAGRSHWVSGAWQLSQQELACIPNAVVAGEFPDNPFQFDGMDGITVKFSLTKDGIKRELSIWCPEFKLHPDYAGLLHWCWHGLYANAVGDYRLALEQLYSYFDDWGLPARSTANGLRIFGGLGSGDEPELEKAFDEIRHLPRPEIDVTQCGGVGTLLYPLLRQLHKRLNGATWHVNRVMERHLLQAGIPESAIILSEITYYRRFAPPLSWDLTKPPHDEIT
jgi:hypothetical protein